MKKFSKTTAVLFAGMALAIGTVGFLTRSAEAADDVSGILMAGNAEISNSSSNTYDWSVSSYEGITAVQPGNSGVKSSSSTLSVDVSGTGVLAFGCYVSSEATYDKLIVSLDGTAVHTLSGVQEWQKLTVPVDTDGSHTITFAYSKDSSVDGNDDTCYIGDLSFCEYADESDFTFDSTTGKITAYKGSGTAVAIPDTIDGVEVNTIGNGTFSSNTSIKSIVIPDSVTGIDTGAFKSCTNLVSAVIPDSVSFIGDYTFYGCTALISMAIPDSVMSVGKYCFYKCTKLIYVLIPDSVTYIGGYTFYNCTGLTSITAESITAVNDYTFYGCTSLTEIFVTDGITNIGDYAFYNCSELTDIDIGNYVTNIGDYAFYNCDGITNMKLPETVITIGQRAFYSCSALSEINIPSSVTTIKTYAFGYCSSLTSLTIPDSVTSIGAGVFWDCQNLTNIELGSGLTSIGSQAFYCCYGLTSLELPDTISILGTHVFWGCSNLTNINIPSSLTSINEGVFIHCRGLTSIEIPDSVTSIGDSAFYNCTGLTSIEIPNSVTSIGNNAFNDCESLMTIEIPDSVISIGYNAFYDCTSLTHIEIGKSVTSIGERAFNGCTSLTYIEIGKSVTSIGESAFNGCTSLTNIETVSGNTNFTSMDGILFNDDLTEIVRYPIGKNYKSYSIPDSVITVGSYSFFCCTNLTSITIPDSVTSIGDYALSGCTGLTAILIPELVTSIGEAAFSKCTNLTSITIPDSVTSIGDSAFSGCTGLTSIIIPDSVTSVSNWCFYNCTSLTTVVIGSSVTSITGYAFGYCEALTSISIPDSVTSISSNAFTGCDSEILEMHVVAGSYAEQFAIDNGWNYVSDLPSSGVTETTTETTTEAPIEAETGAYAVEGGNIYYDFEGTVIGCDDSVTSADIPEKINGISITAIGENAFYNCTSLINISIPDSVTSIGSRAFGYCSGLTSITIPTGVTSISTGLFYYCTGLTGITIPEGVTSIGSYAFHYCSSLTSVVIPDSVTYIGENAFSRCTNLEEVTMGNSVETLEYGAFYFCKSLTSIEIPDSVTSIGTYTFYSAGLTSVEIPDSVTSIGTYAFEFCGNLTSITLPGSIKSVGNSAFAYCTGLESITILNTTAAINSGSFDNCNRLTVYCIKNSTADNIGLYPSGSTINYISLTVTYDYSTNGGDSADMESMSLDESAEADLSVEAYKDGWEFVGWNVDPDAESGLESYTAESDVTLYAIYKKAITANLYSGDCELQETITGTLYNNDTSAEITLPEVGAYSDYEALGWRDDTSVSTSEYTAESSAWISEDTDFYAVYKRTLTLSYNANGGTSTPESQTAVQYYSASGSLQRKTFTLAGEIERSGYSFEGWAAGGTSGKTYSAGASISVSDDTTMYALWTATTAQTLPEISASAASSVTASSAVLNGVVENDGGSDIINRKFIYYEKNNAGAVYEVEADSSFTATISNLKSNTEYWFYASANNLMGYGNSVYKSFTTLADGEEIPISVEISPSTVTVRTGATVALATKVLPTTAANKNIVWTSSDEAIAEVDADGTITGIAEGQATITATTEVGRLKATATVTVTDADVEIDLSEWNMYSNTRSESTNGNDVGFTEGGLVQFAVAYLSRWNGPVSETDDPYPTTDGSTALNSLSPKYHSQNILFIPKRTSADDNDNIKNAVMTYGGVATAMYYQSKYLNNGVSYYMPSTVSSTQGGHQIVIIGWDDNYDKSNFGITPEGNSAFICKNSYGDSYGDGGYFYVSYYDKGIGIKNSISNAVYLTAESASNYNKKYEYDPLGPVAEFSANSSAFYSANVFPEKDSVLSSDEELAAVSFYTYSMGTAYDIYVVKDYEDKNSLLNLSEPVASGTQEYAGYHTVEFDSVKLERGTRFAVVVKFSKPDTIVKTYVELPIKYYTGAIAGSDESYYSTAGALWTDLTEEYENANFCIKAFTNSSVAASNSVSLSGVSLTQTALNETEEDVMEYTVEEVLEMGLELSDEYISFVSSASSDDEEYFDEIPDSIEIDEADVDYLDGSSYPEKYDLRDYGYVTSAKNQGTYNSCWAFAAIGSMESTTARKMLTALDGSSSDLDGASEDALLSDISVDSVSIDKGSIVIAPGAAMQLTYTISPSNASNTAVIWNSSNDNVVSVDTGGNITAKKAGTASITITTADGNKTAQCSVTVLSGEAVTGIAYDETEISCKIGKVMLLDYTVSPGNAADKTVFWVSSNPEVVSVNENGLVTALSAGEAVITVITEDGGYESYCTVTVNDNFNCKISEASNTIKQYGDYVFGNITLNIDNNGEALSEAVVIIAIYDDEGKLVKYITGDAVLGQGSNSMIISDIVFESSSSSLSYKIMLWDSEENMIPLAAAVNGEI